MKLRSLRLERNPQLMIIPMIDIIFFLLVFFMMSTLYMVEQRTIPVNLPQATAAQSDLQKNVTITVTAVGKVMVDQEEISWELLQRRVQTEMGRNPNTAFVLRADRQIEYGKVIAVLDELKTIGVHRVAVATDVKAK